MTARLTEQQIADARRLRKKKHSIEAIADALGISKSAVHRAVRDMPVDLRRDRTRPEWFERAIKLVKAGKNRHEVSKQLGVHQATLYKAFKDAGVNFKSTKGRSSCP